MIAVPVFFAACMLAVIAYQYDFRGPVVCCEPDSAIPRVPGFGKLDITDVLDAPVARHALASKCKQHRRNVQPPPRGVHRKKEIRPGA